MTDTTTDGGSATADGTCSSNSNSSSNSSTSEMLRHLRRDPVLARVIDEVSIEFDIKPSRNRYRSLVESIITQQLSGHSAAAISTRFKELYTSRYPRPADVACTPDSRLRESGLSWRKIECIKEISRRIDAREVRLDKLVGMSDGEIMDTLTQVRGIGRWTAEIFMIFGLGRVDVLPAGDLGLRKGIKIFYAMSEMPSEDEVERIARMWRPYRTVATWYIWKAQ